MCGSVSKKVTVIRERFAIASRGLEHGPDKTCVSRAPPGHETIFAPSNSQCPLEIHMREDGDNSAQSEQMLSALALVLHNTQSTLVHYS